MVNFFKDNIIQLVIIKEYYQTINWLNADASPYIILSIDALTDSIKLRNQFLSALQNCQYEDIIQLHPCNWISIWSEEIW